MTGARHAAELPAVDATTTDTVLPLAEAKLAAPRQRTDLVQRPHLSRALDGGAAAPLTLVSAPPGYGKTTAVRVWAAERQAATAWVTLDDGDNDPVRLWTYVATAIDRLRDGLGRSALRRLALPGAIDGAIDELANGIAAFGGELVVVLDDVETVTDPASLGSIDRFVERLPATARLVLITRADPALRLARLRARGALVELRARDLAFSAHEASDLLVRRGGLGLTPAEIETLVARTEGWPAALYLAQLWLRSVADPAVAAREFGGSQHFVGDYLSREVLGSLDPDVRSFLLRISVLGRFTPELCDGVLGRSDAASLLASLERSNLFVTRLERGGWFRVHPLFAEFALLQLAAEEPTTAAEIHRRAAEWLRSHRLPVEAAGHAVAAGDQELAASLLADHHLVLIRSGATRTLLRSVRALPDALVVEYPELAVAAATATTMQGNSAFERRRYLQLARRAHPERITPYVEAVGGMVRAATIEGDIAQAVVDGRRSVALAEAHADDVLVAALAGCAQALYFAGELDEAWATAQRAVEHPDAERRPPGHALARTTLALVAADRSRLDSARAHAEKAKALVGGIGGSRSWLGAGTAAALGVVLAAEGKLAEAERELAFAEHFFRDEVATVHGAWTLVLLASIRCRRGRLEEADAALDGARAAIGELNGCARLAALADDVERKLALARARAGDGELLEPPSEAELAVLRLLASDSSTREIGARLFLSPNTVRSHTRAIYRKLGVHSRAAAVARADALGLLEQSQSPM